MLRRRLFFFLVCIPTGSRFLQESIDIILHADEDTQEKLTATLLYFRFSGQHPSLENYELGCLFGKHYHRPLYVTVPRGSFPAGTPGKWERHFYSYFDSGNLRSWEYTRYIQVWSHSHLVPEHNYSPLVTRYTFCEHAATYA